MDTVKRATSKKAGKKKPAPKKKQATKKKDATCHVLPDTDTVTPDIVEKRPKYYGKTKRALDLVANYGMEPKEALIMATGNTSPTSKTVLEFKEKVRNYVLSQPSMVKLAHKAVKDVLGMKPIVMGDGKEIIPSHTNRLAAASMVYDRVEPVIRQNMTLNVNANLRDLCPAEVADFE